MAAPQIKFISLKKHFSVITICEKMHLRKLWWVKRCLDDSCINRKDGEYDASEEHEGQLVDILYTYKDYNRHEGQHDGAVHTHVIQQRCLGFCPLQTFHFENSSCWHNVDLQKYTQKCSDYTGLFRKSSKESLQF